jgi:serine/threonine protein kinase
MSSPDSRIDHACDRFEEAWRAGRRPRIEAYLADSPEPDRPDLLRQLLRLELELRRGRGEGPTRDEYTRRFPTAPGVLDDLFGAATSPAHPPAACTRPAEARAAADENLLFGILALQLDFINRDALIAAMNAWVLKKSKPLGQILVEQGTLSAARRALLEPLVREHVREHGDEVARSLFSLGMHGSVREDLEQIPDADLHASLSHVAVAPSSDGDPGATLSRVGAPTTPGSRFLVLRPHAVGGLGVVSIAQDQELNREVALKEIRDEHADKPDRRARFLLEAEITGALEHPGIVPVYGLGHYPDGRPFYAMRFIQGDSLKTAIVRFHGADDRAGRDPGERALALRKLLGRFIDVCNALAYAHSRGVLHRDLKPDNIMLGPYGETLVIDWGLAKTLDRTDPCATTGEVPPIPASARTAAVTLPGTALGTPAYMSPEQAAGQLDRLGPASDVYSLGATLYHLLTGRPPFDDRDPVVIVPKVRKGQFPSPCLVKSGVPRALEAICLKAMALRPEGRYASPRGLADDVERWLADEPVSAHREGGAQRLSRWARRHRPRTRVGAALLLTMAVVLVGGAILLIATRQRVEALAADHRRRRVPGAVCRSPSDSVPSLRHGPTARSWPPRRLHEGVGLSARIERPRGRAGRGAGAISCCSWRGRSEPQRRGRRSENRHAILSGSRSAGRHARPSTRRRRCPLAQSGDRRGAEWERRRTHPRRARRSTTSCWARVVPPGGSPQAIRQFEAPWPSGRITSGPCSSSGSASRGAARCGGQMASPLHRSAAGSQLATSCAVRPAESRASSRPRRPIPEGLELLARRPDGSALYVTSVNRGVMRIRRRDSPAPSTTEGCHLREARQYQPT